MKTVGIAGLGLIGGSMAKAIKKHTDYTVYGADTSNETMAMALMSGAVDGHLDSTSVTSCDLLLLAIPPRSTVGWVERHAALIPGTCVLVDLCGVKREIVSKITPLSEKYGFQYIGGHPMAGKECAGFENADAALFDGASMILTPDKRTDIVMLDTLKEFFLTIGFERLTFTNPEEHDRIIAYTSQLAHISSSAYVKSPTAQTQMGFSAGSYRDMTRVARLDEDTWTDLFSANRDNLIKELREFIGHLNEYLDALESEDNDRLHDLLRQGRELKETAGGT